MKKRISDKRLNDAIEGSEIPPIPTHAVALDYALDLRDERACVRELGKGFNSAMDWREAWEKKYTTLRDAVRASLLCNVCASCKRHHLEQTRLTSNILTGGGGDSPQGNKLTARPTEKTGSNNDRDRPALDCPTCGRKTWDWVNGVGPYHACGKEPKE
jgi:hypothetical protein